METARLFEHIRQSFPEAILSEDQEVKQPWMQLAPATWPSIALYLRDTDRLAFDFLHAITGIDYGVEANELGVVYHLSSLLHEHQLVIHLKIPRSQAASPTYQPTVPTVSHIWRAADWHERETYDFLGIQFAGHPDMRRILLPEDWEGYPLRKDYQTAETYHGVRIDYED